LINDSRFGLSDGGRPSIVAHSFGSYIVGYAILKYQNLRFDKIIFCGSILPVDFPWATILDRGQVNYVRNEYGVKDIWVRSSEWFIGGAGSSGQTGFKNQHCRLQQAEFHFDHSEYFESGHMHQFWIPFLRQPPPASRIKETGRTTVPIANREHHLPEDDRPRSSTRITRQPTKDIAALSPEQPAKQSTRTLANFALPFRVGSELSLALTKAGETSQHLIVQYDHGIIGALITVDQFNLLMKLSSVLSNPSDVLSEEDGDDAMLSAKDIFRDE
jgi:hypothetical protein